MNVDLFQNSPGYPSIKWYFIAAVPLMILVIVLYLFIKSSVSSRRENPLRRGVYEEIYYNFATEHPQLWSRAGPRSYVVPKDFFSKLKWMMVKRWFDPSKTIQSRNTSGVDEMSVWGRLKRRLAERWLGQIKLAPGSEDIELGLNGGEGEFSTLTELLQTSMPIAMADAEPIIALSMGRPPFRSFSPRGRSRSSSGGSRRARERTSSPGSDMVIEEEKIDDEGSGKDKEKEKEPASIWREVSPTRVGATRRSVSDDGHVTSGLLDVPGSLRRGDEHAP
jgi:hypothetical protein